MKIEELLQLQNYDTLRIKFRKYYVIGMMKFTEGDSYWIEYMLKDEKTEEIFYLDVEPIGKVALHQMIKETVPLQMQVNYQGKTYELFQKGHATIDYYYGYVDVMTYESVEYYEYRNSKGNHLFTIEEWSDMLEYSVGTYFSLQQIQKTVQ